MTFVAYTDGACKGNREGGWGFRITTPKQKVIENNGYAVTTTNNRMELTAMIKCVTTLNNFVSRGDTVQIYTDSRYVKGGIVGDKSTLYGEGKGWLFNWLRLGIADKKKNLDLWLFLRNRMDELHSSGCSIDVYWVKAHSISQGNNRADELANIAIANKRELESRSIVPKMKNFKLKTE